MADLARWKKHLERFGPEAVMEVAQHQLDYDDLIALQGEIDKMTRPKPRGTAESRVRKLLGLDLEKEKPSA